MKQLRIIIIFWIFQFTLGFLEQPSTGSGQCVWFGECGSGWNNGRLNCPASGTTSNPSKLTDPEALGILKTFCPSLYTGDNGTNTCCSADQIRSLKSNIVLPEQLLGKCPACFYNFLNQICQVTCSPHQAMFVWANMSALLPPSFTTGIPAISVVVSTKFATDMYNSCKDVQLTAHSKAMEIFCGHPIAECSPLTWLNYMGNTGNGRAPFPIHYILADGPWHSPDQLTLEPLNLPLPHCQDTLSYNTSHIGSAQCSCKDCPRKECPAPPVPTRKQYFDSLFGVDNYRTVEIIIRRRDDNSTIIHELPPPAINSMPFNSLMDKNFLKQVHALQGKVADLQVTSHNKNITLIDICKTLPSHLGCVIESVIQYYQNSDTNIDKIVMDEYGIFELGNYLDHFMTCTEDPEIRDVVLDMACHSDIGSIVQPYVVLQGYQGIAYNNAMEFVLTFVLQHSQGQVNNDVHAWENAFVRFMKSFSNPNMSVTYSPNVEVNPLVSILGMEDSPILGMEDSPNELIQEDNVPVDMVGLDEDHCIWYGESNTSGWNNGALNRPATNVTRKPPLLTDKDGLHILAKYCPQLYNGDNNTYTCCDTIQLKTFESNLALPDQLLSRCPACYSNFLSQLCQMTCSPIQSRFIYANMTAPCPSPDQKCAKTGIPSITYVMTDKFASDLYISCKDVQMPSANDKAMSLFCGQPVEDCDPHKWFGYMGNTGNGRAPFPILYHFSNETWITPDNVRMYPLNLTNTRCNETVSNTSEVCSCQDCQMSCAAMLPPPPPKEPFLLFGLDGVAVIMGIIFIVFFLAFGIYVICYSILSKDVICFEHKKLYQSTKNDNTDVSGSRNTLISGKLVSPADVGSLEKLGARVEEIMTSFFTSWGRWCSSYPLIVLLITLIVFGSFAGGIARYQVTTDPVQLWSSPQSTARQQKDYFDSHFGPFYRTEQLIITRPYNKTIVMHEYPPPSIATINFSSLFDLSFMHMILDLQNAVEHITALVDGVNITLSDICFKPLAPDHEECTIMSVLQYWQNNETNLDKVIMDEYNIFDLADHFDHFLKCAQAPASVSDTTPLEMSCLGAYGGPAYPWVVLGGYDGMNYQNATAFVITFVVNNHLEDAQNKKALAWEAEFIKFMKSFESPNMTVSFSSERSIQDELDRESNSDIWTIVLSYLIMFGYITIALGHFQSLSSILIDSKITLGLGGVTIVLLSVAASVGFYSYCGVPMTLIIIEVVPFLVLAVGVDNIFILVQTYQRDIRQPSEKLEDQIGRVLGTVGPSMLLTSFSESIAFFLGALTDMPAVREFALYAAMAVLFDFILQITCFISLMTLDAKRQEENRYDICCFIQPSKKEKQKKSNGYLFWLVKNYYADSLLTSWVRPLVIIVFVGWSLASIALTCHLTIGLDQALSMPVDSYVLNYFNNISVFLSVGAPVYFVIPAGHNYTSRNGQDVVCGSKGCRQDSLIGQVFRSSQLSTYTYISQPASSWLDDYFDWINSAGDPPCCRLNTTGGFCPATSTNKCTACPFEPQIEGRPTAHDFIKYLPMYLVDNPGLKCAKGGHAAYGAGVNLLNNKTQVGATYFMTYHTPMKTSQDYINGLQEAIKISQNISLSMNVSGDMAIFPYSIFYVFYEQYLTIVHNTVKNIGTCMGAILFVTFVLLGFDLVSALIVFVTILMIVLDLMGMMYIWDINLNALSLVNLVMAIGISVEFCSHIARAFSVSLEPNKVARAKDALAHMGSSVLSGITLTKLGGIIVLAFAKSQLFQVFYFRMYLGMVVFGASHGLIFLPVLLSYVGPGINKAKLLQQQENTNKDRNKIHQIYENGDTIETSKQTYSPPPSYYM